MLASEALSIGVGARLTEAMVAFTCDRCGQTTTARDASITRHGAEVKYACPRDGTSLGTVTGTGRGDLGFAGHADFAIQLDGAWIAWAEFVERDEPS
jgi:predicted RNA-binding Zn-ribbon protein involved in translation (DUF1610 family)